MTNQYASLGWFLVGVIGLALLQRQLHQEIQSVLFLLTRRIDLALAIFSILFLPGVLLHETSHYLAARLLKVPVGRFSLIPQPLPDGRLRLGYVETAQTDFIRDGLIGAAPLIAGSLFVAYAGFVHLDFLALWIQLSAGDLSPITAAISLTVAQPDFWIWFYVIFVVSSTMFPSESRPARVGTDIADHRGIPGVVIYRRCRTLAVGEPGFRLIQPAAYFVV